MDSEGDHAEDSKAYEAYGAPVASGMVVGTIVAIFIEGLLGITKFLIPY